MKPDPALAARFDLFERVEHFLFDAAPALLGLPRPELFSTAVALYAELRGNGLAAGALREHAKRVQRREDAERAAAAERAPSEFPFNPPAPYLRDVQPRIEAMLAPLSDRRQRAHLLTTKPRAQP